MACQNSRETVEVWVFIWVFNSVPLVNVHLCKNMLLLLLHLCNITQNQRWWYLSVAVLLFRTVLAYLEYLYFHTNFKLKKKPVKKVLEFWWVLHWLCRFLLVGWAFSPIQALFSSSGTAFFSVWEVCFVQVFQFITDISEVIFKMRLFPWFLFWCICSWYVGRLLIF